MSPRSVRLTFRIDFVSSKPIWRILSLSSAVVGSGETGGEKRGDGHSRDNCGRFCGAIGSL